MIYTVKEVAQILKVNTRTVKNWLQTGSLKGFKAGRAWRINQAELDRIQEEK